MTRLPSAEDELHNREVAGIIRASHFVRKYSHSHDPITIGTIRAIHKKIFENAWPEIAGEYRIEEISVSDSHRLFPHWAEVPSLMMQLDDSFSAKLNGLKGCEGVILNMSIMDDRVFECIDRIVQVAAWIHHALTDIHPFREGNGRTARLMANLVLERYGLIGL